MLFLVVSMLMGTNTWYNCLAGSAAGWGRQDDAGVVKVWESFKWFSPLDKGDCLISEY